MSGIANAKIVTGPTQISIDEENINDKIDLNISQENISIEMSSQDNSIVGEQPPIVKKKKKIIKKKKIRIKKKLVKTDAPDEPFADVGYIHTGEHNPHAPTPVLEWLVDYGCDCMPIKMSSKNPKCPDKQTLRNGHHMDGYDKTPNNNGVMGYWAKSTDFRDLTKEQLEARRTERNWNNDRIIGAHEAKSLCWIDVDTEFCDDFIKHLINKHPNYPSMSATTKEGRCHIPVVFKNLPEELPTTFMGVGPKCQTKCYYTDEVSEKADQNKTKIEIYTGGWMYFNKLAEMKNHTEPIAQIDYTKFKEFIRTKKKKKSCIKKNNINHTFQKKKMDAKTLDMFVAYSSVIKPQIWDRVTGKMCDGGSWKIIMNAAKAMGMAWDDWNKLCKKFPKEYHYEKNKKMWDDLEQQDCRCNMDHIMTMARGVLNEETGEYTGNWKACDELDSQFIQFEKFSRFYFNKICIECEEAIKNEMEGNNEEIADLMEKLEDLEDDKKEEKDRKKRKKIREEIKLKKQEIRDMEGSDDTEEKIKEIIDNCYTECKKYFEKFHFKIKFPECGYAISNLTDIYFMKKGAIKDLYENMSIPVFNEKKGYVRKEWFDVWRKCMDIRTVDLADFIPPPLDRQPYEFNLFRGLAASRLRNIEPVTEEEMLDIFGTHIKILTGGADPDYRNPDTGLSPEMYFWYYLAFIVQYPGIIPEVGIIFCGEQGTGKSLFNEKFGEKIFGRQYCLFTAHMNMVTGQFPQIQRKLLVIMDETQGKEGFANKDVIKNLITQPRICWEEKHKNGIMINNCSSYWFNSNNDSPLCIELGDRRFVVYVCSPEVKRKPEKQKTEYFNRLAEAFEDDRYVKALYDYLMNFDLTLPAYLQPSQNPKGGRKFHPKNNRPFTGRYCDIQSVNVPLPYYFFSHITQIEGINLINTGDPENSPELYQKECERILYEKTHLKRKNGTLVACNQPTEFTRMELWEQYEDYLDLIGKQNAKEWADATKFWRKICSWINSDESWSRALELFDNDNGSKSVRIHPIELRECISGYSHLLRV